MTRSLHAIALRPASFATALARVWADGGAVLPIPPDAPPARVTSLLAWLRPETFTHARPDGSLITRRLPDPVPVPDGIALVVATSGSTGDPKAVALDADALEAASRAGIARLGCTPGDRWILALPPHHVGGVQVLMRAWALGTHPIVVAPGAIGRSPTPDAEFVSLVPTQLVRLLERERDLRRHPAILLGGARATPGLLERAREAGGRVVVSYGMTETCGGCVYDGTPLDGVEVRIRGDRRIEIRGRLLFHSYVGDPAATAAVRSRDGWFTTGDLGRLEDGRLEVLGRADDVVLTGGENVPTGVVVRRLLEHPKVADAAVVGRPDDEWGERLVAVVVPARSAEPPALGELRDHVRARHPDAYAPRELTIVDDLPRDAMGKLARAALRRLTEGRLPGPV